jgi:guanylate kinase
MPSDFPDHPVFLLLIGPSGAGKSTLMQRFLADAGGAVERCLSCTTRPPRGQERDGVDYHFLAEDEFSRRVAADGFLEHARVFGRHAYGTLRAPIEAAIAAGRSVVKDVDVQGAALIRASFPAAVQVFIAPPSPDELERRLRNRGTEDEAQVQRRLDEAARELRRWHEADYVVVNDDLDRAAGELLAIWRACLRRVPR